MVEDDPDARAIYRAILEVAGFAVLEATNGTEGLRLARECIPAIIIMDLGVPGIDGWTVMRLLCEREETAAIPVVVITGYALPLHEVRAREAGCAGYLTKPVEPRRVVTEIRRILAAPGPAR